MKIGIESGAYIGRDAAAGFRRMKELGYECVDFQNFCDIYSPLFTGGEAHFERELKSYRAIAEAAGIEICQCHGPWRWPAKDNDPAERAIWYERMVQSLRGAAILGCPYMVVHPLLPYLEHDDPVPGRLRELNMEFFGRLTKVAEQEKVTLCLENMPMPDMPLAPPSEMLQMAKDLDSPYVKVCLDTGHCTMCCGEQTVGDQVRLLGKDYLAVLHVHDNDGVHDYHWLPYTGVIDWPDFAAALKEIGFDGCLSLETHVKSRCMPADVRDHEERGLFLMAQSLAR